jgi:acetyl-CoA carboxylase biotin carboxyl carrier protein
VNWDETLERVRSAAEFCVSSGLTRFRIDEEHLGIEVRRSARRPADVVVAASAAEHEAASAHSSNGAAAHAEPALTVLKAEFVGIVRLSRPAVAEGTLLPEDRELAYVESLGIRNPVRSGRGGRVAAVFVSDGEPVGYGQPLFAIEA